MGHLVRLTEVEPEILHCSTNLVQGLHDVGQVQPRSTLGSDLVEQVISEQFQQISVTSLGPVGVLVESSEQNRGRDKWEPGRGVRRDKLEWENATWNGN